MRVLHRHRLVFLAHAPAADAAAEFARRGWDWGGYTTFVIARNPFDRVVSLYHHRRKMLTTRPPADAGPVRRTARQVKGRTMPFGLWVRRGLDPTSPMHMPLTRFAPDAEPVMFDRLGADLPAMLDRHGIDAGPVPMLNRSHETRRHWRSYYTSATRRIVADVYRDDLDRFGFAF